MDRKEVSIICKAMSDPNRIYLIEKLTQGEQCACVLLDDLRVTQPTLSHHMKVLSDSGLVNVRKDGKWSYYSINCERFSEFKNFISQITCIKDNAIIANDNKQEATSTESSIKDISGKKRCSCSSNQKQN